MVSWRSLGGALEPLEDPSAGDTYWAPEVASGDDGRYWMYYSVGVEDRDHRLRVAVADGPEGPFRDCGAVLAPDARFAIDPSPFRDTDGSWYLYYATDVLDGERVGTSLVVDRLVAMDRLEGRARTVRRASADWQLFRAQREMYGAVYDWYTLEGPFVRLRDGRYHCFYSGGCWESDSYGVGLAVADHPLGPFAEQTSDEPTVLRTVPRKVIGPGHNCVVAGPDGEDWIVYHAWDPQLTARRMCIDRLEWGPDGARGAGPTFTPQPAPRRSSRA